MWRSLSKMIDIRKKNNVNNNTGDYIYHIEKKKVDDNTERVGDVK